MKTVQLYLASKRSLQADPTERLGGMAQHQLPPRKRNYQASTVDLQVPPTQKPQDHTLAPSQDVGRAQTTGLHPPMAVIAPSPDRNARQLAAAARDRNLGVVRDLTKKHGSRLIMECNGWPVRQALKANNLDEAAAMWRCLSHSERARILTSNNARFWDMVVPYAAVATIEKLLAWTRPLGAPAMATALTRGLDAAMTAAGKATGNHRALRLGVVRRLWEDASYPQWHLVANRHLLGHCAAGDRDMVRFIITHTEENERSSQFDLPAAMRSAARAGHLDIAWELAQAVTGAHRQNLIELALDECSLQKRPAFRTRLTG